MTTPRSLKLMITTLICSIALGCAPKPPPAIRLDAPEIETTEDARRVLVVMNSDSPESQVVASYYVKRRGIPKGNVVIVHCPLTEEMPSAAFKAQIQDPVRDAIKSNAHRIDFIVLTKGIPIRLDNGGGYSVDAFLGAMDLPISAIKNADDDQIRGCLNPYFNSAEPFDSKKFGFYLVTRLDGYTVDDCKGLVDRALEAKPHKGPFFFDGDPGRKGGGYGEMEKTLDDAETVMSNKGFDSTEDMTPAFVAPDKPLAGYASWGSNDAQFKADVYHKLRFLPGALAETFVSTSARSFKPQTSGQSMIADLIQQGVTGVKGYVSEPFTFALAKPNILFDRYTSGLNLAESFYSASLVLKWKDLVIGDPICNPYRK